MPFLSLNERASALAVVTLAIMTGWLDAQDMPPNFAIENGIISDVGESVLVPAGTWVVDGSGLTVYPGLAAL